MRISDWSSDVCSSDLPPREFRERILACILEVLRGMAARRPLFLAVEDLHWADATTLDLIARMAEGLADTPVLLVATSRPPALAAFADRADVRRVTLGRSEEHTSELPSLMRNSYAVFWLENKKENRTQPHSHT